MLHSRTRSFAEYTPARARSDLGGREGRGGGQSANSNTCYVTNNVKGDIKDESEDETDGDKER